MSLKGKTRLQISLSNELLERMDEYCDRLGVTRSNYVAMLVAQNLDTMSRMMDAMPDAINELIKQQNVDGLEVLDE